MRRFTDDSGDTVVELKPGITVTRSFAKPASFKVHRSVISKAQPAKGKKAQDPIVAVEPERELRESHIGILREVRPWADPMKAYRLPDTIPGHASLGRIGKQEVGKITVHVPYPTEDYTESFTSWIPAKLLQDRRVKRGVTVAVDLERIHTMGRGYAWFCDSLDVVQ